MNDPKIDIPINPRMRESMPEMSPEDAERLHKHPDDMIIDPERGCALVPLNSDRLSMLAGIGQDVKGIIPFDEPKPRGILRRLWEYLFA